MNGNYAKEFTVICLINHPGVALVLFLETAYYTLYKKGTSAHMSPQICSFTKFALLKSSRWVGYIHIGFICCSLPLDRARTQISADNKGREIEWRKWGERKWRQNLFEPENKWAVTLIYLAIFHVLIK